MATDTGSIWVSRRICREGSYSDPQKAMFSGVSRIAPHRCQPGHRHRQRRVAPGPLGEEVRDIAARAGRHQDQPKRDRGLGLRRQHQQEGQHRQYGELRDEPGDQRLGPPQQLQEVGGRQVDGDREHHHAQDRVQQAQRAGAEIQNDLIHQALAPRSLSIQPVTAFR